MPDGIPIAEKDVVALDEIAMGVIGLRVLFANVYAIFDKDWVLVDAGLPLSAGRIRRWAEKQFGEGNKPAAIVLTHGHFDHVGAVKDLADEWDVPVYAHDLEMPYLTGQASYPPPDPTVGGGAMAFMSPLYPRGPIDLGNRVKVLPADGRIPGISDWEWIHTPGHTDGHVSFFRATDRTLIAGDAVATTKPESFLSIATQKAELHGPPAYLTSDWDAARDSVEVLAALKPRTIAPGHGTPMSGDDVQMALDNLARNFDAIARPHDKRAA